MSFLSRSRFMARSLTRRASTWETISKVMPTSRRADFNATVAAFQKRKEKAADAVEDANIDFDSYKEVLGDAEVEAIRKEYEAYQYTDFEAEKKAELAQVQAALTSTIAAIEAQSASLTAAAAAASEELQQLERTRTTLETTLSDVVRRHPDLAADLEARIANEDWDTEAKPVDINALRMEAIEENWDAATLGTLDENSQKEFLDEISSLDAEAAADADVEVPEAVGQFIAEWADVLGRPVDVPAMKAFAAANKVTDADKALTNERDIFREIEMATELGMFERAEGLMAHATELQKSGAIVTDDAWRATETKKLSVARSHQDYNNPVAPEELEGKSAEELSELADAAAANADYYGASQYMYASLVANGKIDTSATSLDTFAGLANALHRRSKTMAQ